MSNNGKPTAVSQLNREQAILEAAEREFLAKGFAGARTTSIAEAAGVTHALLHYYFRTKEQLFDRILDEKLRLMGQTVLAAFGRQELPLLERLKEGIETHFDFIAANPDLPRFIVNEVFSRPERYEAMRVRIRGITDAMIRELQSELDASAARGETEGGGGCEDADARHHLAQRLFVHRLPHHRAHTRGLHRGPESVFRTAQGGSRRGRHAAA